jgi:hypothetical protein
MNEDTTELDFLEIVAQHRAAAERLKAASQQIKLDAAEAKQRLAERAALEQDIAEGSVESLLRAKATMNANMDALIAKTLGIEEM